MYVAQKRPNTSVYQVIPIGHYANYTTKPQYVTHKGPAYVVYNSKMDCAKGIERPIQKTTLASCEEASYRDPALNEWIPSPETDVTGVKSRPIVLRMAKHNVIYCLYNKIKVNGV